MDEKGLKVTFLPSYPLSIDYGGGRTYVLGTKKALEKIGIKVKFLNWGKEYIDFDIIHMFGFTTLHPDIISTLKKEKVKIVISPIFDRMRSIITYHILRGLSNILPFKTLYALQKQNLGSADTIICSTRIEAEDLKRCFQITESKISVIPLGVDPYFLEAKPDAFVKQYGIKDFALSASGFISKRKNQLRLVKAIEGTDIKLVITGRKGDEDIYSKFLEEIKKNSNIIYIPHLSKELLASAYAAAKINILPSLAETAGLVCLEAALGGANIVASELPCIREYLKDYAYYCNPKDVRSIRKAILLAYNAPKGDALKKFVMGNYSWEKVAFKTLNVYKAVMKYGDKKRTSITNE